MERRQKLSDAKSIKVTGRRFKTRSVGLVEAETFFPLVAFNLAGHKNRLQIFPVPGEINHHERTSVVERAIQDAHRQSKKAFKE